MNPADHGLIDDVGRHDVEVWPGELGANNGSDGIFFDKDLSCW